MICPIFLHSCPSALLCVAVVLWVAVKELRDVCVSLDAACSGLAQEHHALKSSAAQLWTVLSSELLTISCDEQQIHAPPPHKSALAAAASIADIPSSVRLLVQQNDALMLKLLQLFKNKISKLDSVVREHALAKAALDVSIEEQLMKMDKMQLQIQTMTSDNAASEQRHTVEVSSVGCYCISASIIDVYLQRSRSSSVYLIADIVMEVSVRAIPVPARQQSGRVPARPVRAHRCPRGAVQSTDLSHQCSDGPAIGRGAGD